MFVDKHAYEGYSKYIFLSLTCTPRRRRPPLLPTATASFRLPPGDKIPQTAFIVPLIHLSFIRIEPGWGVYADGSLCCSTAMKCACSLNSDIHEDN